MDGWEKVVKRLAFATRKNKKHSFISLLFNDLRKKSQKKKKRCCKPFGVGFNCWQIERGTKPSSKENNEKKRPNMNATVTELNVTETGLYASATCGKISAIVCINDYEVRVICQNAAHKVWRGAGKAFKTIAEALAAYKTPEMKAIIAAVDAKNS